MKEIYKKYEEDWIESKASVLFYLVIPLIVLSIFGYLIVSNKISAFNISVFLSISISYLYVRLDVFSKESEFKFLVVPFVYSSVFFLLIAVFTFIKWKFPYLLTQESPIIKILFTLYFTLFVILFISYNIYIVFYKTSFEYCTNHMYDNINSLFFSKKARESFKNLEKIMIVDNDYYYLSSFINNISRYLKGNSKTISGLNDIKNSNKKTKQLFVSSVLEEISLNQSLSNELAKFKLVKERDVLVKEDKVFLFKSIIEETKDYIPEIIDNAIQNLLMNQTIDTELKELKESKLELNRLRDMFEKNDF